MNTSGHVIALVAEGLPRTAKFYLRFLELFSNLFETFGVCRIT